MAEKPVIYRLHSMVMSVHTREKRHSLPGKRRWVQYLGGGQITIRRNRPAEVGKEVLLKYLPEIQRLEKEGMLQVRLPSGEKVDLTTLQAETSPPPPPPPPKVGPVSQLNPSPSFFPYMNSEGTGGKTGVPPVQNVEIQPADVSLNIQRGDAPMTHSIERDPAKRRRQRRSE